METPKSTWFAKCRFSSCGMWHSKNESLQPSLGSHSEPHSLLRATRGSAFVVTLGDSTWIFFHCRMHILWKKAWFVSSSADAVLVFSCFYQASEPGAILVPLHRKFLKRLKKFSLYFWLEGKWDKYLTKWMMTFFFQSHFNTALLANFIPVSTHLAKL